MNTAQLRILPALPPVPSDWKPEHTLDSLARRKAHREAERVMMGRGQ